MKTIIKNIIKKLALSLFMGIFIGLGIFITYAATLTSVSDNINSGDILGSQWYNDLKTRIINIYGSGGNVGIGTASPTTKLEVNGTVKATAFQGDGSGLTGISAGSTIPSGFIGSFYLTACPSGWVLADGTNLTPDLRGAFIRGMGGDANGRDITRTLGSYQADELKSHNHPSSSPSYYGSNVIPNGGTYAQRIIGPIDSQPYGGSETRPKNVALIYCMKQ